MIVILTGAGISKESGLDTFRDADGLWGKVRMEDVATPEGFARDPDLVNEFHNSLRRQLARALPNEAHLALARLESESARPVRVITQNIDDLHERAGSRRLWHMHGELLKARCLACGAVSPWSRDLGREDACPQCGGQGSLRPHVVWFGEIPLYMEEIETAVKHCRIFVSIGTSGNVYPAAGLASLSRDVGARVIELNLEPSLLGSSTFHEGHYGPATKVVPVWVEKQLAEAS